MCMFYILYINDSYCEMDVQSDLHCMINYFTCIIVLLCIVSETLCVCMWPIIGVYVCFILCDIQSDLYCMIKYLIIILLSNINDDGFYTYLCTWNSGRHIKYEYENRF
jgi:hypothetical protein